MSLTVETWIEALESGRYKQTNGVLRRKGEGFCCLGVLCDLSGLGEWQDQAYWTEAGRQAEYLPRDVKNALDLVSDAGDFEFDSLPSALQTEILTHLDGKVERKDLRGLIYLNDAGVSFPLIAKVIRARPKGLFREAQP